AVVLLLAAGLQESLFQHRFQVIKGKPGVKGPARGYLQFELGTRASKGGVWGVYLHRASNEYLRLLCRARDCSFDPKAIWTQIETDDVLAMGVGRLLIWTDPKPLPDVDDEQGAWELYALRCWRPGALKRDPVGLRKKWARNHAMAREFVSEMA